MTSLEIKKFIVYLIINMVCLGSAWIPQENISSTSSTKFVSLFLWYQGIAGGTKNPDMLHQRKVAIPHFMWSLVFKNMTWTYISQIRCTKFYITQKHQFYILEKHHWAYHIHDGSIHPFCHIILLRIIRNWILMCNLMLLLLYMFKILKKMHVFSIF